MVVMTFLALVCFFLLLLLLINKRCIIHSLSVTTVHIVLTVMINLFVNHQKKNACRAIKTIREKIVIDTSIANIVHCRVKANRVFR